MRHLFATVLALAALSFVPSRAGGQARAQSSPQSSAREIAELRGQIAALQKKVEELESRVNLAYLLLKDKQDRTDSVTLDLTEPTYQRLDTDNGFFLISSEQATPYLNGYKVTLKIGNPLSVSFSGFKATVKWGKTYDYKQYTSESYDAWQKALQEKQISFADVLERGTWNKVELVLAPATAEQLGYVNVSLSTNTVRMYEK